MRKAFWLGLCSVVLLASCSAGYSQPSPNCSRAEARGERCIEMETGHTALFRLDKPFKALFVGDPTVADAVVQDQTTFLLNAKQREGRTNIIALDDQTNVVWTASIVVTGPPDPLPVGRVRVHGKSKDAHEYWVYACTDNGCQRLKEEYPGERSKELFVPGLRNAPQITINNTPNN
jgi:Flp pilus assembly secretin CpaC